MRRELDEIERLAKLGMLTEACDFAQRVIQEQGDSDEVCFRIAIMHQKLGQYDTALEYLERANRIRPDDHKIQNAIGVSFRHLGRMSEAEQIFGDILERYPSYSPAVLNLGNIFFDQRRFQEALLLQQGLFIHPEFSAMAKVNSASIFQETGDLDQSESLLLQAIREKPDFAEAHWNLSNLLLMQKRFREAWKKYIWYQKLPSFRDSYPFAPKPQSEKKYSSRSLLVYAEQGLGDIIQFSRLIPPLVDQFQSVKFWIPATMKTLLSPLESFGVELVTDPSLIGRMDFKLALMELPVYFNLFVDTDFPRAPRFGSFENKKSSVTSYPTKFTSPKIGFCFQGNKDIRVDRFRSLNTAAVSEIINLRSDCQWISLQRENDQNFEALLKIPNFDQDPSSSFSDSSSLIPELDLVVTVDTSVAHLAAQFKTPVALLLKQTPDWRWFLGEKPNPFYPDIHIFKQTEVGSWKPAIEQLERFLKSKLTANPV